MKVYLIDIGRRCENRKSKLEIVQPTHLENFELLSKMRFEDVSRRIDCFCMSSARRTTCRRTMCMAHMKLKQCTYAGRLCDASKALYACI